MLGEGWVLQDLRNRIRGLDLKPFGSLKHATKKKNPKGGDKSY